MAPPPRTLRVDLHGYDVLSALELAVVRTSEAYRNGYEAVELVHGGADVTEPVEEGRGRIKWELRRLAERGRFNNWADPSRTWPNASSLVLFGGTTPSLSSPAPGHPSARPGTPFWPALHRAGFTDRQLSPFEDASLPDYALGCTNLVNRATARADEVTKEELLEGGTRLRELADSHRPAWVAI